MARVGPAATLLGVVSGGWNIFAYLQACRSACPAETSAPSGLLGGLYLGLSIVLLLASLGSVVGPRPIFYAMALVAGLADAVEALGHNGVVGGDLVATFVLVTLCAIFSLLAAGTGTGVSEQSHPMNLPVFG